MAMTRVYTFNNMIDEVTRILGGAAEAVIYQGKREIYKRGEKEVTVERLWMFDDERGNVYDVAV